MCYNTFEPYCQAEGLTAMEAWVIACIVFVFAALMEYTGILLQVLSGGDGGDGDVESYQQQKIGKLSLKIRIVEPQN